MFDSIIENIPGVVYRCQIEAPWRVTYISSGIQELTGYAAAEFLEGDSPRLYGDLIHPDDLGRVEERVARAVCERAPFSADYRLVCRDGGVRWVYERGKPSFDPSGRPLWLDGLIIDISPRREADLLIVDPDGLFRSMAEHMHDVFFITDLARQRIVYVNPAFERVWGMSRDHLYADSRAFLRIVHPEDAERVASALRAQREGLRSFDEEYRILPPGADERHVRVQARYLRDESGRPWLSVGVAVDVTHLRRSEQREQVARLQAEAENSAKTRFVAQVSHELRTPLVALLGWADILSDSVEGSEQRHHLSQLRSAGEQLLRVLNQSLDMSRIAMGQLEVRATVFPVSLVFQEVESIFRPWAAAKGLALRFACDEDGMSIRTDRTMLQQILVNLVGNGVKFTDAGGVVVRAACQDHGVRLTIEDTGIGFAEEMAERIFEPFVQADTGTARRFDGTGLGLAITRDIVRLLGGTVSAETKQGGGARFVVVVPTLEASDDGKRPGGVEEGAGLRLSAGVPELLRENLASGRDRVLVVEDNPVNRQILVHQLRALGLQVDATDGAKDALRLISLNQHLLVFVDLHMPDMDGFAFIREVRSVQPDSRDRTAVVVALTADPFSRAAALEAGFDEFLLKPLKREQLADLLAPLIA